MVDAAIKAARVKNEILFCDAAAEWVAVSVDAGLVVEPGVVVTALFVVVLTCAVLVETVDGVVATVDVDVDDDDELWELL